jgi:hypothetical protein
VGSQPDCKGPELKTPRRREFDIRTIVEQELL